MAAPFSVRIDAEALGDAFRSADAAAKAFRHQWLHEQASQWEPLDWSEDW